MTKRFTYNFFIVRLQPYQGCMRYDSGCRLSCFKRLHGRHRNLRLIQSRVLALIRARSWDEALCRSGSIDWSRGYSSSRSLTFS